MASFPFVLKTRVYDGTPSGFACNISLWSSEVRTEHLDLKSRGSGPAETSKFTILTPGPLGIWFFFFFLNWTWSKIQTAEWNSSVTESPPCFFKIEDSILID